MPHLPGTVIFVRRICVPYHLDERLPALDVPVEVDETITLELADSVPWRRMAVLYDTVADVVGAAVKDGEVPYVFSGDCTTSLGTVAGLQRAGIDPSIIWFDAHGDVHTPQTTVSGYLGGMPLRLLTGVCPEVIADLLHLRPVPEEKITLVDARDLDSAEAGYLATAKITRAEVGEIVLPDGPIYLHLDFDVVDSDQLPGLLFPAPGGPSVKKVARAVRRILDSGRVVAFGGACTWIPGSGAAETVRPIMADL
jgi:arginase